MVISVAKCLNITPIIAHVLSFALTAVLSLGAVNGAKAEDVNAEGFEARILVRASNRIEYKNEIIAPIKAVPFLEGHAFNKGDTLIQFNCLRYEAEEKAAKASAHAAAIEHNTKRRLHKYQAVGKNEVALAAAQSAEAHAQLDVQKVRNQSCEFNAPFDGRVVELNAHAFEFPPTDRPLIVIINDTKLEMEMVVPSHWLRWLKPGVELSVAIDETGETGLGKIERIAAEVDPVSQTVKAIASFTQKPASVLAGMSGSVKFLNRIN